MARAVRAGVCQVSASRDDLVLVQVSLCKHDFAVRGVKFGSGLVPPPDPLMLELQPGFMIPELINGPSIAALPKCEPLR
jgi:hypothetical protein